MKNRNNPNFPQYSIPKINKKMLNEVLYKKLIEVARKGKTIPYGEVMSLVGLKPGNYGANEIGKMLGEISISEHTNGRPLLSAVVATGKKPGKGFFWMAKDLKLQTTQTDDEFFQAELRKVHEYWQGISEVSVEPQYWLENYWPSESERPFLGVWFHKKKKIGPEKMRVRDRVIFYETRKNPDGYKGGAKTIFALGTLTNEFQPIPKGKENRGGKEWQIIRIVSPDIWLPSKDGVPYKRIIETLPQFKGWVRQGIKLSKKNFEILESMLREKGKEEVKKELAYKEGAELRVIQTARERNPALRKDAIEKYGNKCMVCGFDFDKTYGRDIANGYIEVHHEKMLANTAGERDVTVNEVKVVCSNCHRMIHKKREMLNWEALRNKLKK